MRSYLTRLLGPVVPVCLLGMMAALVYGHWGAERAGLSLTESYVTEHLKAAPHWPWLVVACFLFAAVLFLIALSFLQLKPDSVWVRTGCLFLAATSMATFFSAYAPVRRVEQPPPPKHEWWTPSWWFHAQTASTPYDEGRADAYSDVHYRATRLVVVFGVAGILSIALGLGRGAGFGGFSRFSIAAAIVMALLFWMGDQLSGLHGLWQRLGFATMYVWLWAAHLQGRKLAANP